jgi:hypothetical protein
MEILGGTMAKPTLNKMFIFNSLFNAIFDPAKKYSIQTKKNLIQRNNQLYGNTSARGGLYYLGVKHLSYNPENNLRYVPHYPLHDNLIPEMEEYLKSRDKLTSFMDQANRTLTILLTPVQSYEDLYYLLDSTLFVLACPNRNFDSGMPTGMAEYVPSKRLQELKQEHAEFLQLLLEQHMENLISQQLYQ